MQYSRHMIQDGDVVTYARSFEFSGNRKTTYRCDALGPFEVSVSRNAIIVHRAVLRTFEDFHALDEALTFARVQFNHFLAGSRKDKNALVVVQCEVFSEPGG